MLEGRHVGHELPSAELLGHHEGPIARGEVDREHVGPDLAAHPHGPALERHAIGEGRPRSAAQAGARHDGAIPGREIDGRETGKGPVVHHERAVVGEIQRHPLRVVDLGSGADARQTAAVPGEDGDRERREIERHERGARVGRRDDAVLRAVHLGLVVVAGPGRAARRLRKQDLARAGVAVDRPQLVGVEGEQALPGVVPAQREQLVVELGARADGRARQDRLLTGREVDRHDHVVEAAEPGRGERAPAELVDRQQLGVPSKRGASVHRHRGCVGQRGADDLHRQGLHAQGERHHRRPMDEAVIAGRLDAVDGERGDRGVERGGPADGDRVAISQRDRRRERDDHPVGDDRAAPAALGRGARAARPSRVARARTPSPTRRRRAAGNGSVVRAGQQQRARQGEDKSAHRPSVATLARRVKRALRASTFTPRGSAGRRSRAGRARHHSDH